MPGPVAFEVAEGVGLIRIDRPPANAIDRELGDAIAGAVAQAGDRDDVGAVVVWGGPKLFAAGADLRTLAEAGPEDARPQVEALGRACDLLEALPKVSVAAINGYALGGGLEIALACDLRIAGEDAKLGQPEVRIGVIPGAGATQRLVPLVGLGRAADLVLTGRIVEAQEGLAMGLVGTVVPAGEVLEAARTAASAFARGPRTALAAAKEALRAAVRSPGPAGHARERELFLGLFGTPDQREGMGAFLEKRDPTFGS
jgi:enoyl-CoA hydratase/carnithine racemase